MFNLNYGTMCCADEGVVTLPDCSSLQCVEKSKISLSRSLLNRASRIHTNSRLEHRKLRSCEHVLHLLKKANIDYKLHNSAWQGEYVHLPSVFHTLRIICSRDILAIWVILGFSVHYPLHVISTGIGNNFFLVLIRAT